MHPQIRRLGIDPGAKRIGLAISDGEPAIACAYQTLHVTSLEEAARQIAERAQAESVEELVIGLPLQLSGVEGTAARRARMLAKAIGGLTAAKIVLWDERLSTVAAQRAMAQLGISVKKSRSKLDQSAAVVILQSYLDSQSDSPCGASLNPPDLYLDAPGAKSGRRQRRRAKH
jgi:putative holliday junction resolvase